MESIAMYNRLHRVFLLGFLFLIPWIWTSPVHPQSNSDSGNTDFMQQNPGYNTNYPQGENTNQPSGTRNRSLRNRSNTDQEGDASSDDTQNRRPSRTTPKKNAPTLPVNVPQNPNAGVAVPAEGGQPQAPKPAPPSKGNARNVIHRSITDTTLRQYTTLYLESPTQYAIVKQPITVSIGLSNKKKAKFDRLGFLIQYDPLDFEIISGKDAPGDGEKVTAIPLPNAAVKSSTSASPLAKENQWLVTNTKEFTITRNSVDSDRGMISLEIHSVSEAFTGEGSVIPITLLPLRESKASISFLYIDPIQKGQKEAAKNPMTRVSFKEKDQLGTRFSLADGVVNLDLPIFSSLQEAERQPIITKAGEKTLEEKVDGETLQLSLIPKKEEINVGELIHVDVVVTNPEKKPFDEVNLLIAYNPRVFEPVDGDEAATGINLADKDYSANIPLDFALLNIIDKDKGIIDYRKKATRKPVRAEGVIATIQLRAILPTQKSTFRLFMSDTGKVPTTSLSYRYADRLGDPSDPFDGVTTCSIGVRPTTAFLKSLQVEE